MNITITGIGTISAIGNNCEETLLSLKNCKTGISKLEILKTIHNELPAGEVKLNYDQLAQLAQISDNETKVRTPLLGLIATREALKSAKLENTNDLRIAFISGTTVGGMDRMEQFYDDFTHNDTKNSFLYPHDIGDSSEFIADHIGIFSYVTSISTACSSGANAIILGAELIKNDRFDIVVAGGCESLSVYHFNGFNSLKILDNEICRPFDESRAGLNLGEGAGYVVLESDKIAKKRGIKPICKLSGYGNSCDAYHQTATSENGEGPYLAMKEALKISQLKPQEISYINCHGTGTPNNDLTESIAIKRLFGENIPPFSSTKAYTGHTTSASGGVEAVISILCIQKGFIPPNLNFKTPIETTGLKPITEFKNAEIKHVMTNSFGFGGNDSSLIFSNLN
ncbi:MAG: beta-ketoacyl-[acyl-carrier-protein] synthase family protein [Bacteroidales bacterium]|nr:beta-ketoacyl-[acyl-carrier-protein] synthase family protein [Bacteroidales bacterium]